MTDGGGSPHCSQNFASSKPPGSPFWVPYRSFSSSAFSSGGRHEEGEVLSFFKFKMMSKTTSLVPSSHFVSGDTEAWT